MLKQGDLVKYHKQTDSLDGLGFVLGQFYEVTILDGVALVQGSRGPAGLEVMQAPTELGHFFTLHRCPIQLPKGKVS